MHGVRLNGLWTVTWRGATGWGNTLSDAVAAVNRKLIGGVK